MAVLSVPEKEQPDPGSSDQKIIKLNEQGKIDDKEKLQGIEQAKAFVRFIIRPESSGVFETCPDECWKDRSLHERYISYGSFKGKRTWDFVIYRKYRGYFISPFQKDPQ